MFGSQKQTLKVEGMMCIHCASHVEEALSKLDGVKSAKADLDKKTVLVKVAKPLDASVYEKAIADAGYRFTGFAE